MLHRSRSVLARMAVGGGWARQAVYGRIASLTAVVHPATLLCLGLGAGAFAFSLTRPTSFKENLYVLQAQAFLQGRTHISGYLDDVAVHEGKHYVPFPPAPAILLVPWVLFNGAEGTSARPLALLLTAVSVGVLARILRWYDIGWDRTCWVLMAFFLGTGYWFLVVESEGVWYLAQVVAVAFVFLAIHLAQVGRPALAGLALGTAVLSRQMTLYAAVFILALLLVNVPVSWRARRKRVLAFALPLGLCMAGYLIFNAVRFGSAFDCGYAYLQHGGPLRERFEQYGLFHPAYVLHNFIYLFLQGPRIEFEGLMPVGMDPMGTSLLFASPFVILAVWANTSRLVFRAAAATVGATVIHVLFYYNNGWMQVNTQRFTLDFLPVLIVLVGIAARTVNARIIRATVVYSVVLNTLALLVIPLIPRVADRMGLA